MRACPSCGYSLSVCSCRLTPKGATSYRLAARAGRYRWSAESGEVASAAWRDHCWDLREAGSDDVVMCLVGGSEGGRTKVALLDHLTGATANFTPAEPMTRTHLGAVSDGSGRPLVLVRADGPTGLHLIDAEGHVLALVSRRRARDGHGADVLVTAAGSLHPLRHLLAVTLALELLRAGALRHVA